MKKVLSILLVLALALCFVACGGSGSTETNESNADSELATIKAAGVLKVGMECDYAPYNWTQTTETATTVALPDGTFADGYDVRVAKKIADSLGVKLEIVKTSWDGLLPALTSGKIDAIIAGMSPTEERKITIDFTDTYYDSTLVLVVLKDGKYASATKLDDFAGAKVTGQLDTFHYSVIDQINGVDKQTALETFPDMIVALSSGKIDAYVSELPGAKSAKVSNPDLSYVQFGDGEGFKCDPSDSSIAVGIRKGSDLNAEINKILATISADERNSIMDSALADQPVGE